MVSISDVRDSKERFPPSRCDPGTRRKILSEIEWWTGVGRGCHEVLVASSARKFAIVIL